MNTVPLREVVYQNFSAHSECIMGADIGGTNSNFGFFYRVGGKLELLVSVHAKSQKVSNFTSLVQQVLEYVHTHHALVVRYAAFAAAGVVSENQDYAKPTNLAIAIDSKDILQQTDLRCAFIVNDFEVIGYGLQSIDPKALVPINIGTPRMHANKIILGAGTGLGKCIMVWDKSLGRHIPSASEGGHADCVPYTLLELDLIHYIQRHEQFTCAVSWESVLSGNGIQRIYSFFHALSGDTNGVYHSLYPDEIFKSRNQDAHAQDTVKLYTQLYARCAKNFALDGLALGGVYIAGGIAAKNVPLFQQDFFLREFINCGKQQELLKNMPVYIITDYNVSLYGVAEYMRLEGMCG